MKPKILIYKRTYPQDVVDMLKKVFEVHVLGIGSDEFKERMKTAVGIIGWGGRIDRNFLDQGPQLKAFSTISSGYDHCDLEAMNEKGIYLMHTPDALSDAVADNALALMLATSRRVVELDKKVRTGQWKKELPPEWYGQDMHKKTLGIVGMGRIGKAIAKRARFGFDMEVLYHSRSQHTDAETQTQAQYSDLQSLLKNSDFVCSVLPKTPETLHYFKEEHFKLMKSSAIFINVGRGQVVDETALYKCLVEGSIYAAGLDVFEKEPLSPESPLMALDNVVLLPHSSSATHETRYNMDLQAAHNLIYALSETPPIKNCVNPKLC